MMEVETKPVWEFKEEEDSAGALQTRERKKMLDHGHEDGHGNGGGNELKAEEAGEVLEEEHKSVFFDPTKASSPSAEPAARRQRGLAGDPGAAAAPAPATHGCDNVEEVFRDLPSILPPGWDDLLIDSARETNMPREEPEPEPEPECPPGPSLPIGNMCMRQEKMTKLADAPTDKTLVDVSHTQLHPATEASLQLDAAKNKRTNATTTFSNPRHPPKKRRQ